MSVLTAKARNALPSSSFALPHGRYPIEDANHARAALSMVSRYGSPAEQAAVRAKVHAKYPGMGDDDAKSKVARAMMK